MLNKNLNVVNFVYILLGFVLSSFLWILFSPMNYDVILNHKKSLISNFSNRGLNITDVLNIGRESYETCNVKGNTKNKDIEKNNITIDDETIAEINANEHLKDVTKDEQKDGTLLHNALLMYVDINKHQIIQFTLFIYASWKYVMGHRNLKSGVTIDNATAVPDIIFDLLVYCHPEACKILPLDCIPIGNDAILEAVPRCWYIPSKRLQSYPGYPSDYSYINTFTFLHDDNFDTIAYRYDWILRTDIDVFISPAILAWVGNYSFMTGEGGYGVPFSEARLRAIAGKLGLHHQNISNIGSTWYAKPGIFQKVAKLALDLSVYFYKNEFKKSLPGLEGMFEENDNGRWPDWWRQVSTMYGSELAINHLIPNLTDDHKAIGYIDMASTDDKTSIMMAPHIHCWHGTEEFNKLTFTDKIVQFIGTDVRNLWTYNETMKYREERDVSGMTIKEYVTYIAWNAILKYLPHIIGPLIAGDYIRIHENENPHNSQ